MMGVNYKGGSHHYKPKPKTATKRSCDSTDPNLDPVKKVKAKHSTDLNPDPKKKAKTKQGQASTSQQASTSVMQKPSTVVVEDTLSSSSSSSDGELPLGLLQ